MRRRGFHKGAIATGMVATMPKLFAATGYYMPDEAALHERTFMQWPVNKDIYPERDFLSDLQESIAALANVIVEFEPLVMLVGAAYRKAAERALSDQVEIWEIDTDDLWARDSGPVFVINDAGELAVRSTNFNGWGEKQVHLKDAQIAAKVATHMGLPLLNNGLVGEAGGVERAPDGVLLANRSSWVNPNRNAGSEQEIEALLLEAFGGTKIIWSDGVKGLDITDDHIDAVARFVNAREAIIELPPRTSDPFSISAYGVYDALKTARNMQNQAYHIFTVDAPVHTRMRDEDFVASYVNYYLCNGALIMAQFGDEEADAVALSLMKSRFPDREIVALDIDPIGAVGGGIHCATQQQPKVN